MDPRLKRRLLGRIRSNNLEQPDSDFKRTELTLLTAPLKFRNLKFWLTF
jgi:hypothetical protein